MLKEVTLGQYYPAPSVLHELDPRVKLFGAFMFVISLFINDSYIGYAVVVAAFFTVAFVSKVPIGYILRGVKPVWFIIFLSVVVNLFFTPGDIIVQFGRAKITWQGVERAFFLALRISLLVLGASILTLTTTPTSLTAGLEKSLGFLRRIGVPVAEMATMISISLRFIPILSEEMDRIMKAQTARGVDFKRGGVFKRMLKLIPILVPLLISAFRRAEDLAMAMDARCYFGSEGRTKLHPLKYGRKDYYGYLVILAYLVAVSAVRIFAG